ncbi:glycosyltransferase family 2 protein [Roseitranquillus sediminis]|uniref:glycosyltransferase family 2 protein n=1 Tax=Roseitranquillus sediminis TaxID=2809051 RepID=UPI001D0C9447|nr:glycosyltransferase family 2 protein [Roseitranquillus sediminis]MBM9594042.1 glycosyltransferase [Roseitranquillus sediminis]
MLISVVTAVLDRSGTVAGALESVALQDHPDVEHVVQDGGSTDGTLEIVRAHAEAGRHPRVALVSERDAGIYDAINRGIARSTGEVVGLLHSDDLFADPRVLRRVAAAFADPEVDAVYGDLDYVTAGDTARIVRRWRAGPFTPRALARGWMPPHPTLFLRRRVFEAHGLYDTTYRIAGDYDGILRWFSRPGFRAVYVPEVLVKMRVGGASNRSLGQIWLKSREDYRALRRHRIGGLGALAVKNVSKLRQFR